jgi:hypothetical protein
MGGTALACNGIFEVATTIPIPIAIAATTPITTSFLIFFSLMTLFARFRRYFCFILVEPQQRACIYCLYVLSGVKFVIAQ